jgi:hypothetical protein
VHDREGDIKGRASVRTKERAVGGSSKAKATPKKTRKLSVEHLAVCKALSLTLAA